MKFSAAFVTAFIRWLKDHALNRITLGKEEMEEFVAHFEVNGEMTTVSNPFRFCPPFGTATWPLMLHEGDHWKICLTHGYHHSELFHSSVRLLFEMRAQSPLQYPATGSPETLRRPIRWCRLD